MEYPNRRRILQLYNIPDFVQFVHDIFFPLFKNCINWILADEKKNSSYFSLLHSNLGRETYHVDCLVVNDYYSQNPRSNWYLIPFDRLR